MLGRSGYPARFAEHHGGIVIGPWEARWAETFAQDAALLASLLGPTLALEVHHIGSTSVPGLPAKPIVDILLLVTDLKRVDKRRKDLESAGFIWCGSPFPGGRLMYNMHTAALTGGEGVRSHVHVALRGSDNGARVLLFRNHLRANAALREKYAALKLQLLRELENCPKGEVMTYRAHYSTAKSTFVASVLALGPVRPKLDSALFWIFLLFAFIAMVFEPIFYFPCEWRLDVGPCGDASEDGVMLALWRIYARWDALFVAIPSWLRIMCAVEVFLFGPSYAVVAWVLERRRRHQLPLPVWFAPFALLFSGALIYSTIVYFAFEVIHEWNNPSTSLSMVFLVNAPWSVAPVLLSWRVVEWLKAASDK